MLNQAIDLTLFGMGFVFIFLTTLVLVIKIMFFLIFRIEKNKTYQEDIYTSDNYIDEETKLIIEQAIRQHRGA